MRRGLPISFLIICCLIPTILHAAAISDDKKIARRMDKSDLKSTPITKIKLIPSDEAVPIGTAVGALQRSVDGSEMRAGGQKKRKSLTNPELLNLLGLNKLRASSSHHRKRLAVESRHHGRPDDSHMFVIKLPPNPYYYSNSIPAESKNAVEEKRKIPVGFKSNGKPGRIYHWNIPVLKKILGSNHGRSPNLRHSDNEAELIDIKNIPTWSKPWENDTVEKSLIKYGGPNDLHEKILKKKSPTYYAPIKAKQANFKNYFPGNGKPKSFYVIEKSLKPIHYHKLIP